MKTMAKSQARLFVCVDNKRYLASLEKRKIYIALRDAAAEQHGLLRIIDESGDDYLYPKCCFVRSLFRKAFTKSGHRASPVATTNAFRTKPTDWA
jgi:hypothetical protein